jgi:hypothetical protein
MGRFCFLISVIANHHKPFESITEKLYVVTFGKRVILAAMKYELTTPAPKLNVKLLFLRKDSNPQIDHIAQERFTGAVENLDRHDMTAGDKKIALLTVYALDAQTVFSYREAALLLGESEDSITKIMSVRSDRSFWRVEYRRLALRFCLFQPFLH